MPAADVDDTAATKTAAHASRHFPGFVQLLPRQTAGLTYGSGQTIKQCVGGKPTEISSGQTAA
jgi:hypothetical protein